MINEFHGKRYYMDLGKWYPLTIIAREMIDSSKELRHETFNVIERGGHYIIYSDAKCGSFRGPKYSAWEKLKRNIYIIKRWV